LKQALQIVWLHAVRHCAATQKVAVAIPDEIIGFFNLPNPSSRTMALGSAQPPTEMSTKNFARGKALRRKPDILTAV
jgi:hypothetical protein